ncbi:hypothetical protein FACS189419_05180 [Planctomycetales bacterium]|nr:hypothetical protein FACS189419_05180 [Planctomycetales bacterium]
MKTYRKKSIVIAACRFEDNVKCLSDLSENGLEPVTVDYSVEPPVLKIETLEGTMTANIGDWVIKGVKGEFYPCKPGIFAKTYKEYTVPKVHIANPAKPWSC